jgi:ribosomal protein S18 acetylase RimI-like enzyme
MYCEVSATAVDTFDPRRVATPAEAMEVSAFLLQPGTFGTPLTPGERDEFQTRPTASIGLPHETYWYLRDHQCAIATVLGVRMHANRTGIFEISALAVHAACRRQGLGRRLLQFALQFAAAAKGRGLLFETSSDDAYKPMHNLLAAMEFTQVGTFPDFYYPGEDTLWYYRPIARPLTGF